MASDEISQHSIPCVCQAGKILVTTTLPDHPWVRPSHVRITYEFQCPACEAKYVIDDKGQVRLHSEAVARCVAEARLSTARKAFDRRADVAEVKEAFGSYLDRLGSVAAVHRLLGRLSFGPLSSIGSFRKNWRGGRDWCAAHVNSYNILAILDEIGRDASTFTDDLDEIHRLANAVPSVRIVTRLTS